MLNKKILFQNSFFSSLLNSKTYYGGSVKYSNLKLKPYIFGIRFKYYLINLKTINNSILKNVKLIQFFLKNRQNILIIGNSDHIKYFLKTDYIETNKQIYFHTIKWVNGFLTNKKMEYIIKKKNINLIIVLKTDSIANDIINESYQLKIPVIFLFNTDEQFLNLNKILYPLLINLSSVRSIFYILFLLKKTLQHETLSIS